MNNPLPAVDERCAACADCAAFGFDAATGGAVADVGWLGGVGAVAEFCCGGRTALFPFVVALFAFCCCCCCWNWRCLLYMRCCWMAISMLWTFWYSGSWSDTPDSFICLNFCDGISIYPCCCDKWRRVCAPTHHIYLLDRLLGQSCWKGGTHLLLLGCRSSLDGSHDGRAGGLDLNARWDYGLLRARAHIKMQPCA